MKQNYLNYINNNTKNQKKMKKTNLLLIISILLLSFTVNAQFNATEHVKKRMPLTYSNIVLNSEEVWKNDFEMQKYRIDKQCEALVSYLRLNLTYELPIDTFTEVCYDCLKKLSKNDIDACTPKGFKFDEMGACLNVDWELVHYEVENQCKVYNELHK